jgi:hypothetical protein
MAEVYVQTITYDENGNIIETTPTNDATDTNITIETN